MIRAPMARLLQRAAPRLRVLSHSEIPETHSIRIGSIIGAHTHERRSALLPSTSREALSLVRQAFGADAVVLSTEPCADGVEVLAMAPGGDRADQKVAMRTPRGCTGAGARRCRRAPRSLRRTPRRAERADGRAGRRSSLAMSTLSFQDYVRERTAAPPPAPRCSRTRRDHHARDRRGARRAPRGPRAPQSPAADASMRAAPTADRAPRSELPHAARHRAMPRLPSHGASPR